MRFASAARAATIVDGAVAAHKPRVRGARVSTMLGAAVLSNVVRAGRRSRRIHGRMQFLSVLRELDTTQRKVVLASFLGWTLDAFDYFLLVFVIPEVARDFNVGIAEVAFSLTLTLAMRPLGAFIFGRLADRYGRRPVLMVDIVLFAVLEAASALAPSLTVLLIVRALFGIAMGGEWGIGASLAMESIPAQGARCRFGPAAGRLCGGLSDRRDFLHRAVRSHRLARHVRARHPAGAARAVTSGATCRNRRSGRGRASARRAPEPSPKRCADAGSSSRTSSC